MDLEHFSQFYQFGFLDEMNIFSIEPYLRQARIRRIMPHIPSGGVFVDIGCGNPPLLIDAVKEKMDFCIGIDSEATSQVVENVEIKKCFIRKKLPIESELANTVTMLAVLEHLDYPRAIVHELFRIMKPGGVLLLTVPSPRNKFLLEFLAFFGIVRREMIEQHKHYFTERELEELFTEVGFRSVEVKLFQLGMNTFLRAIK